MITLTTTTAHGVRPGDVVDLAGVNLVTKWWRWRVVETTETSMTVVPHHMTIWERLRSRAWWMWTLATIRSWNPCND